jgi:zinc protease
MLDELELDTAVDFYEERFASANDFTFVFVGAVEREDLRPLVERYLAALPGEARDDGWVDLEMDPPGGRVEKVVRKGIEPQSRTAMVFTGPFDPTFQNRFDLRVLAGVLETRLRERLREELGGTYSVGVSGTYERVPDPRYQIRIQFGSDPERAEELREAVFAEIEELRREGPAAEDVASVLETERRSRETALEQNGWWASRLQQAAAYGVDPRKILDDSRPEQVSVETVRADAGSYLDPENVVIVVLKPESPEG